MSPPVFALPVPLASAAMTLDRYADPFDDDLDAVAERLDAVARAAGVYPLCTDADAVSLEDSAGEVVGQ